MRKQYTVPPGEVFRFQVLPAPQDYKVIMTLNDSQVTLFLTRDFLLRMAESIHKVVDVPRGNLQ